MTGMKRGQYYYKSWEAESQRRVDWHRARSYEDKMDKQGYDFNYESWEWEKRALKPVVIPIDGSNRQTSEALLATAIVAGFSLLGCWLYKKFWR